MTSSAQNTLKNYDKEWKQVEKFEKQDLPQSALKEVEKIYNAAKKEQQHAQVIKALVKRLELSEEQTENYGPFVIESLKKEIKSAKEPEKSILYGLLAGAYRNLYEEERWEIMDRTTVSGQRSEDPLSWSVSDFMDEIGKAYLKSVENEQLLKTTLLEPLDAIVTKGNVRHLRPTLFDLLAHQAIEFFQNEERNLTKVAFTFEINQEEAFADVSLFVKTEFKTSDTLSLEHKALQLYQRLLAFHEKDTDPAALIDADILRVSFVYQNSVHPEKETLYKQALERIIQVYQGHPGAAQASFMLASWYLDNAGKYQPYGDETHRYDAKKALEIAEAAMKKYPESEGGINARNLILRITSKHLEPESEKVLIPGKPFLVSLEYRNVPVVHFKVIRVTPAIKEILYTEGRGKKLLEAIKREPGVKQWQQKLPDPGDYQIHRTEVKGEALPSGEFFLVVSSDARPDAAGEVQGYIHLHVSSLSLVHNGGDYFVLHRETGLPLEGVQVNVYSQIYSNRLNRYSKERIGRYLTDKNGYFQLKNDISSTGRSIFIGLEKGSDSLLVDESEYFYPFPKASVEAKNMFYFTDRSIYRPGQPLYFKGILLTKSEGTRQSTVISGQNLLVRLFDANNQLVDSLTVKTNEFGSVAGKFVLPLGTLNGHFRIEAKDIPGSAQVRVEEYKRPKYKVEILKPETAFKLNDKVEITGEAKAFAGNAIDGAVVKFRVERVARFPYPWRFMRGWWPVSAPMQITSGETTTDQNGQFKISFDAIPDKSVSPDTDPVFDYVVYADVTDAAGETRSGQQTVSVAYKSYLLTVEIPEKVAGDQLKELLVKTENMANSFLQTEVSLAARKLIPESRLIKPRLWERPDLFVMTKEEFVKDFPNDEYDNEGQPDTWAKGGDVLTIRKPTQRDGKWSTEELTRLSPGYYEFEFMAESASGEQVKEVKIVEVTGPSAPVKPGYLWSQGSKSVEPGEKAVIKLATAAENVFLIQVVEKTGKDSLIRKYDFFPRVTGYQEYSYSASEEDRGGYGVGFLFVKDNRVYEFRDVVMVPWTNKELEIKLGTFRDKMLPGNEETWTLTVSGKKGDKVAAEVLASMYDQSLDEFLPHQWQKPPVWRNYYSGIQWNSRLTFGSKFASMLPAVDDQIPVMYDKEYDELITLGSGSGSRVMLMSESFRMAAPVAVDMALKIGGVPDLFDEASKKKGSSNTELNKPGGDQPVRSDFRETAFFFPDLKTAQDGSVTFSFTMPEALTKWKFQALSHTEELALGYASESVITQKELMVQPNLPRFLRNGDAVSVSAKIVNLSDKELSGSAVVSVLDAASGNSLDELFGVQKGEVSFAAAPGQSNTIWVPVSVPFGFTEPIIVRVVAKAGAFSDGEDNVLPVLTNQMLVTESLPLSMTGTGTRNFRFEKLLNSGASQTLKNHSLTVEYTANPAWSVIQALPYLMEYPYDCAEQTWNRYFANTLATHLAGSSPRVEQIFKTWRELDTTALLSNLQKNQELKSVLLEETPWVLSARSESEQKRNLALLFDLVRMRGESKNALSRLTEMQLPEGAFPWFKGGPDDRYITQYILAGVGHLGVLVKADEENKEALSHIVNRGLEYLDSKLLNDYEQLLRNKTNLKKYTLSPLHIHYLYMRSFFPDVRVAEKSKKAYEFFSGRLTESWVGKSPYQKGMVAMVLYRQGNKKGAEAIVKSLRETSIKSEELGTFWKNIRNSWYWQDAQIEQHALLVEVFEEVAADLAVADDIRKWLLTNKRTNHWESTKATAEACYALLLRGSDWVNDNPQVAVSLGGQPVSVKDRAEAGTGYFKTVIPAAEVRSSLGAVEVTVSGTETANNRPSWGAIYWQYFEDFDNVTFAETSLKLRKQLFIETNSDRGPVLQEIKDGRGLKVGDKVKVRIILSVDRDMEYVHMKDMRAAGLEPVNVLSSYKRQGGLGYYESTRDASTNFFFDYLPKGSHVFEYPLTVTHQGDFSNGVTTIQCMYAPEFTSHSAGIRLDVK